MIERILEAIASYRVEREQAHLSGHSNPSLPPELVDLVDPYFPEGQDTELVLFDPETLDSKHQPKAE